MPGDSIGAKDDQAWLFTQRQDKLTLTSGEILSYDEYCIVVYKNHPWYTAYRDDVCDAILGSGYRYTDDIDQRTLPDIVVTGKHHAGDVDNERIFKIYSFVTNLIYKDLLTQLIKASNEAIRTSKDEPSMLLDLEYVESNRSKPWYIDAAAEDAATSFFNSHLDVTLTESSFFEIGKNVTPDTYSVFVAPGKDDVYSIRTDFIQTDYDKYSRCSINVTSSHETSVPVYQSKSINDWIIVVNDIHAEYYTEAGLTYFGKVALSIAARFTTEDDNSESSRNNNILQIEKNQDEKNNPVFIELWKKDRANHTGNYEKDAGDINKVMRTIASHPDHEIVSNYVNNFLKYRAFRISLAGRGQNMIAWENTIRLNHLQPERAKLLIELWRLITLRQLTAWNEIGKKYHTGTSIRKVDLLHEERNYRVHLFEMIDFADKIASYYPADLTSKARDLRREIQVEIDSIKSTDPVVRYRMYALNTVWNNIDEELDEEYVRDIDGFNNLQSKLIINNPNNKYENDVALQLLDEREMQLSRLRNIKASMENVLDYDHRPAPNSNNPIEQIGLTDVKNFSLHKSQPLHIFTPNTYRKLKPHIIDFTKQTMKDGQVYLLRLRFEQAALTEVCRRLLEMIDDVTKLGKLINDPKQTFDSEEVFNVFQEKCISLLENLEWGCTRTWQEEFDHDNFEERRRLGIVAHQHQHPDDAAPSFWDTTMDAFGKIKNASVKTAEYAVNMANKNTRSATWDATKKAAWEATKNTWEATKEKLKHIKPDDPATFKDYTKRGGAEPPPEMSASFFDIESSTDPSNVRSKVQLSIDHWKSAARRLFVRLRTALANTMFETVPVANTLVGSFIRDTVNPRLTVFSEKVNIAMRNYLRPSQIDPIENMAVNRALRKQQEIARSGYRITVADGLRFRTSDPSTRFLIGLKLMRFVGQIGAVWAARRLYSEQFNTAVHVDGKAPPPITKMLFTFLGIDATLQLITLVGLVFSSYIMLDHRKYESNVYVIDNYFIQAFLVDYFVTTVTIGVLSYIIASLIRKKAYFHLAEDGERAANAYGWSLIGISGVIAAVPPLFI